MIPKLQTFGVDLLDPCSLANAILDECDRRGFGISERTLQDMLYLVHGWHCCVKSRPLIYGYFEIGEDGPVSAPVAIPFRECPAPIRYRALSERLLEFRVYRPEPVVDRFTLDAIWNVARTLGAIGADGLNSMVCAPGAAWDHSRENLTFFGRIENALIVARYRQHFIPLEASAEVAS
jgi:uncharacterized phage-associated protein